MPKIYPVFIATEIVINYGLKPFDICSQNPELWKGIKILYVITFVFSNMIISSFIYKIIFKVIFLCLASSLILPKIYPIFIANEIIITYGLKPFDICSQNPDLWRYLKILYVVTFIFSNIVISSFIYKIIFPKKINKQKQNTQKINEKELNLLIGEDIETKEKIYLPESGLYQNFLITGTIGSGKTSSAMYPFTEQLIKYNSINPDKKIGMLILDVKGNYYKQVKEYAKKYNLLDDLNVIELGGKETYNPLHKPNLKPSILANR